MANKKYENVTVFTSCDKARHNMGGWTEKIIKTAKVGFPAHREKDISMVKNCDFGVMIWNGKSKGTLANINDLKRSSKKVVIINEAMRFSK